MPLYTIQSQIMEDSSVQVMARVEDVDGADITQSLVTSITRKIYRLDWDDDDCEYGATTIDDDEALTVSSVVTDSLSTSAPWDSTIDSEGSNFRDKIPATNFASANADQGKKPVKYVVEYAWVMVDGFNFVMRAAELDTIKAYGS